MENTLVVFDSKGFWHVEWKYTPEAESTRALFGGTILPTPFSTLIPVSKVINNLKARRPHYSVVADAANGLR